MNYQRTITLPEPRCPFCHAVMEEVQIKMEENMKSFPPVVTPHEVWNCSSCHTNHIFPARVEFLEYLGLTHLLPTSNKVLYLPF